MAKETLLELEMWYKEKENVDIGLIFREYCSIPYN